MNNNKGITLIALIITIVVLLILAIVAINAVQDGGIIAHAKNAQTSYDDAKSNEKLELLGYAYDLQQATYTPKLVNNIVPEGCRIKIIDTNNGNHTYTESGNVIPELQKNQFMMLETNDYIYELESNEWFPVVKNKTKTAYEQLYTEIKGMKVVLYRSAYMGAFSECTNLEIAPIIPDNITFLYHTFDGCKSLKRLPDIPTRCDDISWAFASTAVEKVEKIPDQIIGMAGTFNGCKSLKSVTSIPSNVDNLFNAFQGCTALTGEIEINCNPTYYDCCFASTTQEIVLTGSSTMLQELAATSTNGNVKVKAK